MYNKLLVVVLIAIVVLTSCAASGQAGNSQATNQSAWEFQRYYDPQTGVVCYLIEFSKVSAMLSCAQAQPYPVLGIPGMNIINK